MSKKIRYQFGTISHATMNPEHLAPRFLDCLADFAPRRASKLRKEWEACEPEDQSEFVDSLFDVLGEFAAPYCYFGAHPGDGADYGFWLCENWDQDFADNGGLKVSCTSEVPKGFTGEVCQVSDHGNPTLYRYSNGRKWEIWALV